MIGGENGEDGREAITCLNYNIVLTYAAKAVQELHHLVEQQQAQIDAQKQHIDGTDKKC